jgi:Co/Zn/Cd efflux system component
LQRRILWIALALKTTMFGVEITAGMAGNSTELIADVGSYCPDVGTGQVHLNAGVCARREIYEMSRIEMSRRIRD